MPCKVPKTEQPAANPQVAATPASTGQLQERPDFSTRFKPGQSGNPKGRKAGSRNALSEAFISALNQDFEKHGVAVIQAVREDDPAAYLKIIASIVPKDLNINPGRTLEDLSDDELLDQLEAIRRYIDICQADAIPKGTKTN